VNVFELFGRLTLDGIEQVDKQLAGVEKRMESTGKSMTRLGSQLSMKVTAPLVALGVASFKTAGDFDTAFRSVNVMLDASAEQATEYKNRILEISSATGKTATDVAAAYYQIVSAGYRGADSLDILETAMQGAVGGAADATATTAALTKAMNIFQLEGVEGSTRAMDTFFGIVDAGLLTFEEMATSFPRAASNAAGLGVSMEETGAILATLTKVLGTTEQAATATDAIFRVLISPSEKLNALYEEWGVSSGPEAIAQFGGMTGVLEKLEEATGGNVVAIRELFNSDEAMKGILPILTSSSDELASAMDTVTGSAGRTGEALDEMAQGPGFQWQQMVTQMKNASILLGDNLAGTLGPVLQSITGFVTQAVNAFAGLPGPVRTGIIVVAGLAAATGPLLVMFGLTAQGLGSMIGLYHSATAAMVAHKAATIGATTATQAATASTIGLNVAMKANPIGLVISLIAGLVGGIIALHNNWDEVVRFFDKSLTESERKFRDWADGIKKNFDQMAATAESAFEQMKSRANSTADVEISAAEQVRDNEQRTIQERLGFYRDFTADKLAQIDKQMVAELAAIDGTLGEQAQAYLDLLAEQEEADKKREDEIEARRIRELRRQLESDEDLTRIQRLEIEDRIADYEAQQKRESDAEKLYSAIKESDYEGYFQGKSDEAETTFNLEVARINNERDIQIAAYREQLRAFQSMHIDQLADTERYVAAYNDIMAGIGGERIEIPEAPTPSTQTQQPTFGGLHAWANGGTIAEPTLLYGLKSQRPYAIAGEAGPERVTPEGQGGTTVNNHFAIAQLVVREEADINRIAEKLYRMQSLRTRYA
jgi:TP901 family phage tail tape measure protein